MNAKFPLTFMWPEALWLLLAVPLLIGLYCWLLRRKKQAALRYASLGLMKTAMGPGQRVRPAHAGDADEPATVHRR